MPRNGYFGRRRRTRLIVTGLIAALIVGCGATGAAGPAAAAAAGPPTFISGHARFQVLSPTLIRMEYAGNGSFTDAATFNVVGRADFVPPPVVGKVVGGWLRIDTDQVSVRYRVGSGPFTEDNLRVTLVNGDQKVTATPSWPSAPPSCRPGVLCEAESGRLGSVGTADDHRGFSGSGFVAGFEREAASTTYGLTVPTAGRYDLLVRYANATGGDGATTDRTLGVAVDGAGVAQIRLPVTGDWAGWQTARVGIELPAGRPEIMVVRGAADSGMVNVDSLALVQPGAGLPAPAGPVSCRIGQVCELDAGRLTGGAVPMSDHNGASDDDFVAGLQTTAAAAAMTVTGVPTAGRYDVQLRYSNFRTGEDGARPRAVSLAVNGGSPVSTDLAPTTSWDAWTTAVIPVDLASGNNELSIGCPAADSCHLNIDTIAVGAAGGPVIAPHAPLGGYRRGLDNVDGPAALTPGLLYEDGWYLLDDTPSAVFDPATGRLADRPDAGGLPYQDGYFFGYGRDYKQALRDLTTLTGASKLLPRWAYGVWYSLYQDYTQADYQHDVVPAFRRHGAPLDVLVTDTDFKAPDVWDGWQFDTTKFPDPTGFLDWSEQQGLKNTMNIHPSVVTNDPQYAQAQLTARHKLTKNNEGCYSDTSHLGDCYVFDWSDPDQLTAYFDLHRGLEQAGVDFFWLDWCCEQSAATYPGVTPDAWINEQYARRADAAVGRGFVLSRAFGSLQSGGYAGPVGVPTGPWADKRTTVHFTGDTSSTWASLQFQVGYTGGQAATTGLSPISHDIGGFNADRAKLPEDLYVRWVQLGTFQPILRLHGNHSERLPWQYGADARDASIDFLNLRENLVPYTYTLAQQAAQTGVPVVRPTYLEYPNRPEAFAAAGGQYFYGPDVLVAPITAPGSSAGTRVWFPPGQWTDFFTGRTYSGPSTQEVRAGWTTMPVFLRAGAIVPQRGHDVANDRQHSLDDVLVTVAAGADGEFTLYEDDGSSRDAAAATTRIGYSERAGIRTVRIDPTHGTFPGRPEIRSWTVTVRNATAPAVVQLDGRPLAATQWEWNAAERTVTVRAGSRATAAGTTVTLR